MNFVKRFLRGIWGLLLYVRYTREFDDAIFDNKRVAIVGPANSAYNTNRGSYIDSFDYVIRVNKAPFLVRDGKFKMDIGSKTDVLVHSFFENEFSGGGPLDFQLYDRLGVRYVINPIPTMFGKRATFNFYKKYFLRRTVYFLSPAAFDMVRPRFGRYRPTTGFCALMMVMNSSFSELLITGFTFFKTPYGDGYRDALRDVATNRKYIADSNMHNPDIEYEVFKVLLEQNRNKNIRVDKDLRMILADDQVMAEEV